MMSNVFDAVLIGAGMPVSPSPSGSLSAVRLPATARRARVRKELADLRAGRTSDCFGWLVRVT